MKSLNILLLLSLLIGWSENSRAQCSGGSSFSSVAAPTGTTATTISSCNWAGDYNTITSVVAGSSYTLTVSPSACITIHSGSPTGPVVAFGTSSVPFTAATSGTYYMTLNTNCSGCGTGTTCLTTTITCTSCGTGPCASISNIPGCGQAFTLSTTGSSSFVSNLCATATPGLEQVYTYTATSTGTYSFNVTSVTGGGYAIGWQSSGSGCSASGWNCAGTATTPGSVGSIALTSGTTYYFLMDATSTAASGITFSLTCPSGGPTVAGDCNVAANVCSNASFSIDPNGFGLVDEICDPGTCAANPDINVSGTNSGCLLSGELNSTWMIVNVLTGGTLTFNLGTPNSGTLNCLDWSMWAYTPTTCSAISAGTQAPIRCNYNGSCEEYTGLASTLPAGATSMTNWEAPLNPGSYTQYLICLSNYSSANTTVPLSFGGTAVVSCSPLGTESMNLTGKNESGYNSLEWVSSSEFNVDKYIIERSENGSQFIEIGTVDAQGMSLEALTYRFEDIQPVNGTTYYRVKLVRNNGTNIKSNTLAIEEGFRNDMELVKAFPNPAESNLNIILSSKTESTYQLTLSTLNGQKVFDSNRAVKQGLTYLSIDVREFENGFYFLNILQEGKSLSTHKIIIE
ncbi:T9SS type A sorting domain-containing protein [Fluviicola chungangensis]|uniref:T9SS type A sorting domain-containing protein n=1 Tax=Fluviicola chungangensis TaxID=2597671 RepID=A0A556MYR5_9FLAO|nr:T9SS type A sorting domain-containing protein [Fluviicola chungangensis]TSJ45064.1 T9SS type A sorting domain-containing protein [Fluviicola chungangensis]